MNPYIVSSPPSQIQVQNVGDTIKLNCSARGSPLPKVKWFRDKNNITLMATHAEKDSITSEILIARFKPNNTGNYSCVFQNDKNGTATASTSLSRWRILSFSNF